MRRMFTGLVLGDEGLVVCAACGREVPRADAEVIDTDRGALVYCGDIENCKEEGE